MKAPRDPDAILAAWLDEGPTRLPSSTRRAILVGTRTAQQKRHRLSVPWRTSSMHPLSRLALVAVAVVALAGGVVGLRLLGPGSGSGGGSVQSPTPAVATPAATLTPSVQPSPNLLDTSRWKTYVSTRYGFSIGHPADWFLRPADHDWTFAKDAGDTSSPPAFTAWDHYAAPDGSIAVSAWSVAVTRGTTVGSWIQAYCAIAESNSPCATIQDRNRTIAVTVDGHPGSLVKFTEDTQAFILVGNRMYVVASWRPAGEYDSLRILQAFLSTMHLLPGGPAPAASGASPS